MRLSKEVFTNHAMAGEALNGIIRPLWRHLLQEAASSTNAEIISAYYGLASLRKLFADDSIRNRRSRRLRFVFGRRPFPALLEQVRELVDFKAYLLQSGYSKKNVSVAISPEGRFFHTKAYQFRKNTRTRTFVGSANASSSGLTSNEELVLSYDGRHDALEGYLDRIRGEAEDVETLLPQLDKARQPEQFRNLRDFLSDGLLYFRPSRTLSFSLDCFPGDDYESVSEALTKAQVEAVPPFEVGEATTISVLRFTNANGLTAATRSKKLGFQLPTYAIETTLGYWVPSNYEEFLDKKLETKTGAKKRYFLSIGNHLSKWMAGQKNEFPRLVKDINEMLVGEKHRILTQDEVEQLSERIERRINQLIKRTTTEEKLAYLCRQMEGVPVPAFWEDEQSAEEFIASFCEYIFTKMQSGDRMPGIVRHLSQRFDLELAQDEDEVRNLIEVKLRKTGWRSNDWPQTPE